MKAVLAVLPFLSLPAQDCTTKACALDRISSYMTQVHQIPTLKEPNWGYGTYTACGSLNLPTCWIWYIKSPPFTYSITKYKRSYREKKANN